MFIPKKRAKPENINEIIGFLSKVKLSINPNIPVVNIKIIHSCGLKNDINSPAQIYVKPLHEVEYHAANIIGKELKGLIAIPNPGR